MSFYFIVTSIYNDLCCFLAFILKFHVMSCHVQHMSCTAHINKSSMTTYLLTHLNDIFIFL